MLSLSWRELAEVVSEMRDALLDGHPLARLQEVQQYGDNDFGLLFYKRQSIGIYVSLKTGATALLLSAQRRSKAPHPSQFALFAKKHLLGQELNDLHLAEDERTVYLQFSQHTLVLELQHLKSNALLLDKQQEIVWSYFSEVPLVGKPYADIRSRMPLAPTKNAVSSGNFLARWPRQQTFSSYVETEWQQLEKQRQQESRRQAQATRLRRQERKIEKLQNELEEAESAADYLRYGEALQSYLFKYKDLQLHPPLFELSEWQPPLRIPVAKVQTGGDLMHYYFNLHKKMLRKKQEVAKRLQIEAEQLQKIKNAPTHENVVAKTKEQPSAGKIKGVMTEQSPDGLRVLVGKSAAGNEAILKIAKGNDLWLHVRGYAGSHCLIVREGKKEIPQSTIIWTAKLALRFSKAKQQGKGEVEVALRNDVKKFKNAKPGQVLVTRSKTVHVQLE